ncbi:MAG TPA: very short patch repair endonuclease [Spirillospora sp.]
MAAVRPVGASSEGVRKSMQANKSRDTKPELALRRAVHALGLRYRVSYRPLRSVRRTTDLAFTKVKVAVFLDGCFWHGCPQHHTKARTNAEYWAEKVERNRERDAETDRLLTEAGWLVIRVWEHEDPHEAAQRIAEIVRSRRAALNGAESAAAVP